MTKGSITTLLLWLAVAHAGVAQTTGTLQGRVVDQQRKPIPHAIVRIEGTSPARGAVTRGDGSFVVAGLRAGEYDVKGSAVGFLPVKKTKVRISVDQVTALDFILTVGPPDTVRPIVVYGRGVASRPVVIDRYQGGFTIRGSRGGPNVILILGPEDVELRPALQGFVEQEWASFLSVDTSRVAAAPLRRCRPGVAASRIFSLMDTYPLPYGTRNFVFNGRFAFDDPFTGGFGSMPHYDTYYASEVVSDAGADRYGVSHRDVVEPSMEKRAEWIRGYEEHRDMMSPYERALASWARRR